MRCGNCGIELVSGAAFCFSCGKAAAAVTPEPPVNSAVQWLGRMWDRMRLLLRRMAGIFLAKSGVNGRENRPATRR